MNAILIFLQKRKYEVLLVALIQHLFIGIFLKDFPFYTKVIWPINMLILGIASIGIFIEKSRWKTILKNILFLVVLLFPLCIPFAHNFSRFMQSLNIAYVIFFSFILLELIRFLIKPGYVNADLISASACGYFLLIEISVFLLQFFYYQSPSSINGVDPSGTATIFIDLVYFCSITLTSIGFGDITPNSPHTKLITSFFGIVGQFYSVVLVGILISKFSNKQN